MKTSPITLEIVLHYYYSPDPYPHDSPAAKDSIQRLINDGILKSNPVRITDKGIAWVLVLLRTPYPQLVSTWVDANGVVIPGLEVLNGTGTES